MTTTYRETIVDAEDGTEARGTVFRVKYDEIMFAALLLYVSRSLCLSVCVVLLLFFLVLFGRGREI